MLESSLNVLTVAGSLRRGSVARVIIDQTVRQLKTVGCADDVLDFQKEPLALYNPAPSCSRACALRYATRNRKALMQFFMPAIWKWIWPDGLCASLAKK